MKKRKQITLTIEEWELIHLWGTCHRDRDPIEMGEEEYEHYNKTEMAFEKLQKKLFR